jgi:hypothetical protein
MCQQLRLSDLFNKSLEVYNPKKVQNDEDDSNYDHDMNPTARFREPGADVRTKKAEKPQDN